MKCAIMQPAYLPWAGYFSLINSVDTFVFLDDVQFCRDKWQVFNKFLLSGQEKKLKVPVVKSPLTEIILNINVDYNNKWIESHSNALFKSYKDFLYGTEVMDIIFPILNKKYTRLTDLNMALIEEICNYLGIQAEFIKSSNLLSSGKRSEYLERICKEIHCNHYISPEGARAYLNQDGFSEISNIDLSFQKFQPEPYQQKGGGQFVSYLSIIDVMANLGAKGSMEYLIKCDK